MFQVSPLIKPSLFSSKNKRKKIKCCLLQFLFGALRVNPLEHRAYGIGLKSISVYIYILQRSESTDDVL